MKAKQLNQSLTNAIEEHGNFEVNKTLSRKLRITGENQPYSDVDCEVDNKRARNIEKGDATPTFSEFVKLIKFSIGDDE